MNPKIIFLNGSKFKVSGIAIILILFVWIVGCSNNSSRPPGPPDLSLTLEIVSKDPDSYKGKRVKWYGEIVQVEIKGGKFNNVFIDPNYNRLNKYVFPLAFSVKSDSALGIRYWVTGTVKGMSQITLNVFGPSQSEKKMEVPVLVDAQFEQ